MSLFGGDSLEECYVAAIHWSGGRPPYTIKIVIRDPVTNSTRLIELEDSDLSGALTRSVRNCGQGSSSEVEYYWFVTVPQDSDVFVSITHAGGTSPSGVVPIALDNPVQCQNITSPPSLQNFQPLFAGAIPSGEPCPSSTTLTGLPTSTPAANSSPNVSSTQANALPRGVYAIIGVLAVLILIPVGMGVHYFLTKAPARVRAPQPILLSIEGSTLVGTGEHTRADPEAGYEVANIDSDLSKSLSPPATLGGTDIAPR